jgi:DNA-3-methyladenine glycosylase II
MRFSEFKGAPSLIVYRNPFFNTRHCSVFWHRHPLSPRNKSLSLRTAPTSHSRLYNMSSRRSARLSAASSIIKEGLAPANEAAPAKVANVSRKRKNISNDTAKQAVNGKDAGPSTPKKKRVTKPNPPLTPTPSAIGLMSSPRNDGDMPPPAVNRLAVPNGTNATLVTPETHRVVSNKPVDQVSPSKQSSIKTTTGNILDEAIAHLIKTEPKLKPIIEKHPCNIFSPEGLAEEIDPFNSLISGIISQQVSHEFTHCSNWRKGSMCKFGFDND